MQVWIGIHLRSSEQHVLVPDQFPMGRSITIQLGSYAPGSNPPT